MSDKTFVRILLLALLLASRVMAQDPVRDAFATSYRYEKSQNYEDAIKVLMVLEEQDYLLDLRLGWLYYLSGKFANSRQHYQAAIAAAPKAVEPRLGLMLPLLAQTRYAELETMAKQVLMIDPNNYYASLRLAIALRSQDKLSQAEEINSAMLELYPSDVSFLSQLGLVHVAQKKNTAARQVFTMILTLDPENVLAKQQLETLPIVDDARKHEKALLGPVR